MANTVPAPVRRNSSDPESSTQRPPHLDLFLTSSEDIANPLPSPPYRRDPSQSHLYLGPYPEESPAYKSRSNVDLCTETSAMVDQKHEAHERDSDGEEHPKHGAKTARFEDDLPSPGHSIPPFKRTDSDFDFTRSPRSRSPSIAETDDGEDDYGYDWDEGGEDTDDEEDGEENDEEEEQNFGAEDGEDGVHDDVDEDYAYL